VVDVDAKKAKKGSPKQSTPHRYGQHGVIMRGKKGSKDTTAEARAKNP
jgi:hypothetical protein